MDSNNDPLMESLREVIDDAYEQMKSEARDHSAYVLSTLVPEFEAQGYDYALYAVIDGHMDGPNAKRMYSEYDPEDENKVPATVRELAHPEDRETMLSMLEDPRLATALHKAMNPRGYVIRTKLTDGTFLHAWIDQEGLTIMDGDLVTKYLFSDEAPDAEDEERGEIIVGLLKMFIMPVMAAKHHKHLYRAMLMEITEDDEFMAAIGMTKEDLLDE